jgi:outer membrane protein OmpA-like peptidoglycan-associated protein
MSDRAYANVQVQQKTLSGSSPKSSLLQRTCACDQRTIAGGECSTCRNERLSLGRSQRAFEPLSAPGPVPGSSPALENVPSFNAAFDRAARFGHDFSRIPIHSLQKSVPQTKLKVNQPGDVYEQEADQVAEQVMTTPAHHPLSGTLPRIQRFSGQSNRQMDAAPASVDQALASPGRPLEPALRQDMEPRFGYDFSGVRVHTDAAAEQSARDVSANAYTLGLDIVFDTGRFAPETQEGRRLIAHELTHVVQQKGSPSRESIRRFSARRESFVIRGLPADSEDRPNFVFFELNDATVPESERDKIERFASENKSASNINLYGYASEEGDERENTDLISDRLESVRSALARNFSKDISINLIPRPAASIQQINYRNFRSVEMSLGASSIGTASSNTQTINCDEEQNTTIDENRRSAIEQIDGAMDHLNAFKSDPSSNKEVQNDLDNNFRSHSSSTVTTLLQHLRQIQNDLSGLTGNNHRQCSTPEYGPCTGALALTRRPQITLCPSYFLTSNSTRLETLLHEICHYAFFHAHDRAYESERVLPFLSTAEALDNAESIAIFILEMNLPPGKRIPSTLTTPTSDTIKDCGSNEEKAKEALAWAQRWNTYALFGMSQTYNNWVTSMFPHIIARLGPINDRYILAGIFDRYKSLDLEFSGDFTLECVESSNSVCANPVTLETAEKTLLICPAFFSQNLHTRIVSLYAEVTKLVPDIRDDQRRAYAELARDYKIYYWGLPPT